MKNYLKKIDLGIDLNDSELSEYSYHSYDDKLIVKIKAWNDSIVKIYFFRHLLLIDRGCSDITLFCENTAPLGLLKNTLENFYIDQRIPDNNLYKHYQFLNLDDNPSLEIICENIQITQE